MWPDLICAIYTQWQHYLVLINGQMFKTANFIRVGQSHILKMCDCSFFVRNKCDLEIHTFFAHIRTFLKSGKMCNCTFAHFQRATKSAIAQSLFQNEQMCKNVQKKCEFRNCTFSHFKKIAQLLFQKEQMCKKVRFPNHTFFALKKSRSHIFNDCSFKVQFWNSNFFAHFHTFAHFKQAIVRWHFFALFQKVLSYIPTFLKSDKMCNRTFSHF